MIEYIRNKIFGIASQYNCIDKKASFHSSVFCSGSTLIGAVIIDEGSKVFQSYIDGDVKIGRFSTLWGPGIHVVGRLHGIEIGNFTSIAYGVSIQEDYHNIARTTTYYVERNLFGEKLADNAMVSKGRISIGHDVWIGAGTQVLSGVSIGHGAVIGGGTVVTKDVPPYAVVVGNPARIIKFRFQPQTIQMLLDTAWWDWSVEKIRENKEFILAERI